MPVNEAFVATQEYTTARPRVPLDGRWQFSYDPDDLGRKERWFASDHALPERVQVPGCSQVRAYASDRDDRSAYDGLPELGPSVLLRYPGRHASWWKRRFRVPASWRSKEIWLHAGGIMPAAEVWLNEEPIGTVVTSRAPVRCRITPWIRDAAANTIAVRVFWSPSRLGGGFDGMSAWSGIYRRIWLEATAAVQIGTVHVRPRLTPRTATLEISLLQTTARRRNLTIAVEIHDVDGRVLGRTEAATTIRSKTRQLALSVRAANAALWSPTTPHLYLATVSMRDRDGVLDRATVRFGFREVRTTGHQIRLNGTPIFLRGGCDGQYYPETVCPPVDPEFYRARLRQAMRYGFNYTKSCVEIFTPEFLDVADELGYLVCQEMPFFERQRRAVPGAAARRFWQRELRRMVTADRNHPSLIVYSMSSELNSNWLRDPVAFRFFSQQLPGLVRKLNDAALIFDATGVSKAPEPGYGEAAVPVETPFGRRDTDLDGSWLRWAMDGCPLSGPIAGLQDVVVPFILHEFAWITSLSDPLLLQRYRALPTRALHVGEMIAAAAANGIADELPLMLRASRRLKYALLKYCLELARRDQRIAGYHQWLIHDYPFCAEGVLNDFWEAPADLPSRRFRQCNGPTVLLLDDRDCRNFRRGDRPPLAITVSHFGAAALSAPTIRWRLRSGKRLAASGIVALRRAVACGSRQDSPELGVCIPPGRTAAHFVLSCELRAGDEQVCTNEWDLWAYPGSAGKRLQIGAATEQLVVDRLDATVLGRLAAGRRLLFCHPGDDDARPDLPRAAGAPLYRTVPYNHGTTGNMGTVIHAHPITDALPHDGWCDLGFAALIHGARPFALAPFRPQRIRPLIRCIGHLRTMDDRAYLFELAVGAGRLLVCSLRLGELATDPAAAFLLTRIERYLRHGPLVDATAIGVEALARIIASAGNAATGD